MIHEAFSPQWIAKMYAGKPGRDHLGLGSVSSDQILPSLSPSINVLTYHPRPQQPPPVETRPLPRPLR